MFKPFRWEEISKFDVSTHLIEAAVERGNMTPNPALYINLTNGDDYLMEYAVVEFAKKYFPNCIVWEEDHDGGVEYLDAFIFGKELFGSGPDYLRPEDVYAKLRSGVEAEEGFLKHLAHNIISKEWKLFAEQFHLDEEDKEAYAVFYHNIKTHYTVGAFHPHYVLELCYNEIMNVLDRRK